MAGPIYFPILRAKAGEIDAIGRLAPRTRSLIRPMLDFPRQKKKDTRSLDHYLGEKIQEITASWGTSDEVYLDFSRYDPNTKLLDGRHTVDYVFDIVRQSRLKAVPVVAPLSMRGPTTEYFEAVYRIISRDKCGMALRLPFEYFSTKDELERNLGETLNLTSALPHDVDVYLDAHSLALVPEEFRDELALTETLRIAAMAVNGMHFRQVIFAASNMPDSMTHQEKGNVLTVSRTEFLVWRRLARDPAFAFLRFGDYGVVYPGQVESDAPVIPPSRVRTATDDEYVLHKGDRDNIRAVSAAAALGGALAGSGTSWGANAVRECAAGYGDPGGPAQWVARDTNMHIENTVAAMRRHITSDSLASSQLETEHRGPWLQQSLGLPDDR